jgi:glyceraldehyde 3-phosphate dehydrogenase
MPRSHDQESLTVNGDRIAVSAIRNPAELPWAAEKIDVVFECTGLFTDRAKAAAHITPARAK